MVWNARFIRLCELSTALFLIDVGTKIMLMPLFVTRGEMRTVGYLADVRGLLAHFDNTTSVAHTERFDYSDDTPAEGTTVSMVSARSHVLKLTICTLGKLHIVSTDMSRRRASICDRTKVVH